MMRALLQAHICLTGGRSAVADMMLDPTGIDRAEKALSDYLFAEAQQQRAYVFRFPDGRVSLELEWVDVRSIVQSVVMAYVRDGSDTAQRSP
jgi:hypothetical protein